ncbi:MAG: hypothetical protein LBJ16_01170 [Holosporaceae bacterium]|jgi:hypothetical protein|nr:hypothetical protein [Holosporaceae bacterium]
MKCGVCFFINLVLLLLFGCSNYENDTIDAEGMKKVNRLLIPPVTSKPASSVGKGNKVQQAFDHQAASGIDTTES